MFKNYIASEKDLKAIKQALRFVRYPKMKFVFSDFSRIKNTLTISYDSKYIYVWTLNPIKLIKIPHNLKISDENQIGWRAGLEISEIINLLPTKVKNATRFETPIISGGLLTPFIELQKKKDIPNNPYITKESYMATIIHEFGHIYWSSFKLWWFSDKKRNILYLKTAQKLYNKKGVTENIALNLPTPWPLSEVFASCTEKYASELFWPKHKHASDKFDKERISKLITTEEKLNLDEETSVIEGDKNPHDFASILGKLIVTKYPNTWPEILTRYRPTILP